MGACLVLWKMLILCVPVRLPIGFAMLLAGWPLMGSIASVGRILL